VSELPGPPDGAAPGPSGRGEDGSGAPAGEVYDWYRRGLELLERGDAAAAAQILARAVAAEPAARSLRELLARAQFNAGQYLAARESFAFIVVEDPADHYAQFGLGLSASRSGDFDTAAQHLAIAVALRPEIEHYGAELEHVRATRAARERS
jgi:tetratricopeptide (TPR) repeat protein